MPTPGIAANAYAQLARIADPAGGGLANGLAKTIGNDPGGGGPNFGALLKDVMDGVAAAGRKSDSQAQAVASGKANVVDVVTAVAEAETAVTALVAVRDNVIQSYQQIMSMTI
jgi:flagellar hook-basal body complex protein FliE